VLFSHVDNVEEIEELLNEFQNKRSESVLVLNMDYLKDKHECFVTLSTRHEAELVVKFVKDNESKICTKYTAKYVGI
jgi:hypothetical protein